MYTNIVKEDKYMARRTLKNGEERITTHYQLPVDVHEKLKELAKKERRSLSNFLEVLILKEVERMEQEGTISF